FSSKGKYIAFCEGDDYWTDQEKLQKQYNFMEANPDYSICGHDAFILRDGEVISNSKLNNPQQEKYLSNQVQKGVFILTMSSFFRNLRKYPIECMNVINLDTFLFSYLGQFGHYKYMKEISPACYRIHDGGIWSNNDRNFRQISELNTYFWIAKYCERTNNKALKDHFGLVVAKKTFQFLITLSWCNIVNFLGIFIKLKYPRSTTKL